MRTKSIFILLVISLFFLSCKKISPEQYFNDRLIELKDVDQFEENSEYGYLKIGKFFSPSQKSAVVISFEKEVFFYLYEQRSDGTWSTIAQQQNSDFNKKDSLKAYIEDYNFDGWKDIAISNSRSNDTSVMSFRLWLYDEISLHYIKEFKDIGNPVVLTKEKVIQGFTNCCTPNEMIISEYHWDANKLVKVHELDVTRESEKKYNGILTIIKANFSILIVFPKEKVDGLIAKYSKHWQLVDTTAENSLEKLYPF